MASIRQISIVTALAAGGVLAACGETDLEFKPGSMEFPTSPGVAMAWQNMPVPVEVTVRNNGDGDGEARLAYSALFDGDGSNVRLGPLVRLGPDEERTVSMSMDVRPEWTRDDKFSFRLFLANPDHRVEQIFPDVWFQDDDPDNHVIQTSEGIPVRTLYDRLRLTVLRVQASAPARVLFTTEWRRRHPLTPESTLLAQPVWPASGLRDLPVGEWVDINQQVEVEMGGPALTEGSQSRPWMLNFNIGGQFDTDAGGPQDDFLVTSFTSATLPATVWSQRDHRMTLPGVPFGPFTDPPLQFEIRIEGLESFEP